MREGKQRIKSESGIPSGRGTYAKQACSHCRKRKSKCDGRTPVCGPCEKAGRAAECTWGKETAKKARTQQHFESLENYIRALEMQVNELKADLDECRRLHGGLQQRNGARPSSPRLSPGGMHGSTPDTDEMPGDEAESDVPDNADDIDQLISPTRDLVLREAELAFYGPTSVDRLAPLRASPPASEPKLEENAEAGSSTSFDWSRHLPQDVPLSRQEHDRLLDILFKFMTCWGLRVVPELFLRDMHRALSVPADQRPPRTAHYSPMLHNAAIASALAYTEDPALKKSQTRLKYATKAKSYLESESARPSIPLVTSLSMLATFYSAIGEQSLGFMYSGMCGRMSQALGLNVDCSPWVQSGLITHADMQDRNWAYWASFGQDVCWSLYVGRQCSTLPPRKERSIPVPWVGSEIDTTTWSWGGKVPQQPSYIIRSFEASCELMLIGRRIMEFMNHLHCGSRHGTLQEMTEIDIQLNNWKDSLRPEVDLTAASRSNALPHRLFLHSMYWFLFLLLHRPFYRRLKPGSSSTDIDHVKLCNRAADNIMLLTGIWAEKYDLQYSPMTYVQVIFCAGTSFVLSAVQATSGPRLGRVALTSALSQAEQCIRHLLSMGKSYECATNVAGILSNVLQDQLKPRLLHRTLEPDEILPHVPTPNGRARRAASGSQESDSRSRSLDRDRKPVVAHNRTTSQSGPDFSALYEHGAAAAPTFGPPSPMTQFSESLASAFAGLDALRAQIPAEAPQWGQGSQGFHGTPPVPAPYHAASSSCTAPASGILPFGGDTVMRDVEMDFGMHLGIVHGGQPLPNRPYMAFGLSELGCGGADPMQSYFGQQAHGHQNGGVVQHQHASQPFQGGPAMDFSEEELAFMEQIQRGQLSGPMEFVRGSSGGFGDGL